jgi:hypothetical protein
VVVLHAGIMVLMYQIVGDDPGSDASVERLNSMSSGKIFGLTFGITAIMVIWQMLYLGFLATTYSDKDQPQQPAKLLIVGRYFFWRMIRLQIILLFAYFLVAQIVWGIGVALFKDVLGDNIIPIASAIGLLVLIKPLVLCPAIMIVKNCMVGDSLKWLKSYSLKESPQLIKLIVVCFGTMFMLSMVFDNIKLEGTGKVITKAVYYIASILLVLIAYLGGIGYVASFEPPAEETQESTMEGQGYE